MFHSFLDLLDSTIPQQLVDRIGWVLIHSLWQFSLLAIFALVVLQQLHRQSASTRYFVLSTIMLGTVMTPVVTWCAVVTGLPSDARLRISSTMAEGQIPNPGLAAQQPKERSDLAQVSKGSEDGIRISNTESTIADVDHRQTTSVTSSVDRISSDLWISQLASLVHPWLPTSVFVWALGVLVFSLRPILSWLTIYRLKTVGVTAVDASILERLSMLMQTLHVNRNVTVLTSNLIHTPIVVGVLRSVILLPISLLANLPAAQVEAILAHELAHVKRYDYLVNLLQTMVETLFFYHPAVWWLSRRIRIERENCCDDLVVTALGNRVDYGKALLAVEEHLGFASTLALGARDGSLLARVQRLAGLSLMDQRSRVSGMAAFFSALILTIGVATVVIGSLAAEGDDKIIEFGTASNGLQFRLIALTPDVKDDAPELKNRVNSFKRSADMTFAVELKNVSREPITLAGLRYGEGYADETKGKLNTSMLGPFW
jgi:beta-lactamase regulating signal transducer with metallopeptidase domain